MSKTSKEQAMRILNSRAAIGAPGKYQVKVTLVNPHESKFIVNINAWNAYQRNEALKLFSEGKYREATNQNLTFTIFSSTAYRPVNGEEIYATVNEVTLPSTGDKALLITGISPMPVSRTADFGKIDFDALSISEEAKKEFAAEAK